MFSLALRGVAALLGVWVFYTLLALSMVAAFSDLMVANPAARSGIASAHALSWAGAVALAVLVATALINPWLLDRLAKVQWVKTEDAGDVGPFLQKLLERHAVPAPRLGVIIDDAPYAFTYGLTRGSTRMVLTSGLLKRLDVDEQSAIVAHEAAHLVSGDYLPSTVLATPIVVLTLLNDFFQGSRRPESATLPTGMFLSPVSGVLASIYAFFYGPLSRARERFADEFSREVTGQEFLPRALFRVLLGLGSAGTDAVQKSFALALRGFVPVDAVTAGALATCAAAGNGGILSADGLGRLVAESAANPCARWGIHPPPAPRMEMRDANGQFREAALRRQHRENIARLLPLGGFLLGVLLSVALRGFLGLPLILWGVGRIAYLLLTLILQRTPPPGDLEALLGDLPRWWGMTLRARLDGKLVGFGIPQQTWSSEMVLETAGGWIPLRPRHPLGAFHQFVQNNQILQMVGQNVTVSGWIRVREVPYFETHRVETGAETIFSSGFLWVHLLISLGIISMGILVILPQWMNL
ncbi:MAG: hypothetical protein FJX76_06585 [Armatimonadetes bacterium]|nr:hypothetical protein [Armatimonadota bacterium]